MQVAMYIGLWDNTCSMTEAMESIQQMGPRTVAKTVVAPWNGHVTWMWNESDWALNDLTETLMMN